MWLGPIFFLKDQIAPDHFNIVIIKQLFGNFYFLSVCIKSITKNRILIIEDNKKTLFHHPKTQKKNGAQFKKETVIWNRAAQRPDIFYYYLSSLICK